MTTEIAVMNRTGIALAADSAVTISSVAGVSIRNNANKLFSLSKYHPVGVMIYGNAVFTEIPWEVIIKSYRQSLGDKEFKSVNEYSSHFFKYLNSYGIPDDNQISYVNSIARTITNGIKTHVDAQVKEKFQNSNAVTNKEIKDIFTDYLTKLLENINNQKIDVYYTKSRLTTIGKKYQKIITSSINSDLMQFKPTKGHREAILNVIIRAAAKGIAGNLSGIVIAGYGANDIYPVCCNYGVLGFLEGKTIKHDNNVSVITCRNNSEILSFAQSDDIKAFIEGIAPKPDNFLKKTFEEALVNQLPTLLQDELSKELKITNDKIKSKIHTIAKDSCSGIFNGMFSEFKRYKEQTCVNPVLRAIGAMEKTELAVIAETLVNLVSFRKQVTMDMETVGGPIDVAIITKGDGFIWAKRKHYFKPELNHHFFNNYYRR